MGCRRSSNSIGNIFFYLPDRPTAENPIVKNLPFKESIVMENINFKRAISFTIFKPYRRLCSDRTIHLNPFIESIEKTVCKIGPPLIPRPFHY